MSKKLKEALAQPAQAPVAWMYDWFCDGKLITGWIAHSESEIPKSMAFNIRPLYTAPPQPAQEPVAGTKTWFEDGKVVTQYLTAKDIYKEPAQEPVDWEQIYWDMVNAMLRDKLRAQPAQEPVGKVTEVTANGFKCEFNKRLTAGTKLYTAPPQCKPLMLNRYDAGLLNDFGGGNVDWWWDYLRAELDRAHDFYQTQAAHGIKD